MKVVTSLDLKRRERDEDERIRLYGESPTNPFFYLRQSKGFTPGDLSLYTGVDRRALSRLEDGLYANPLPSVVSYWVKLNVTSEGQLLEDYHDFQFLQRKRHQLYFGPSLETDPFLPEHPFRQLRQRRPSLSNGDPLPVGLVEVSRAMCIPLDTIQFFEKKFRTQQSVPKVLKAALNQMGYDHPQIARFEADYKIWRGSKLAAVTFNNE